MAENQDNKRCNCFKEIHLSDQTIMFRMLRTNLNCENSKKISQNSIYSKMLYKLQNQNLGKVDLKIYQNKTRVYSSTRSKSVLVN